MERFVEVVYFNELKTQCQFVLHAANAVQNSYERWQDLKPVGPSGAIPNDLENWRQEIFRNVHSLLTHSANISKLFWPTRERDPAKTEAALTRAAHLKAVLNIGDDNVLLGRSVRNHLDHYDTRLDEWALGIEGSNTRVIFTDSIGPFNIKLISGPFIDEAAVERGRMRWFDPETAKLHFRGEAFDIQLVVNAIEAILEKLDGA